MVFASFSHPFRVYSFPRIVKINLAVFIKSILNFFICFYNEFKLQRSSYRFFFFLKMKMLLVDNDRQIK